MTSDFCGISVLEPLRIGIAAGWFFMGSDVGREEESPVHRVWVDSFAMASTQVTVEEYARFPDATGNEPPPFWDDPNFSHPQREIQQPAPPALVLYRESCPKGIAGLLAAKCVERFNVPTIVLASSPQLGLVVGSGRSVAGFDLAEALEQFRRFFKRFGGHAQAVGLTMPVSQIEAFAKEFAVFVEGFKLERNHEIREDGELVLATAGKHFDEQLALLEPFGEGNPAPVFLLRGVEVASLRNRWVRIRQVAGTLLRKLGFAEAAWSSFEARGVF